MPICLIELAARQAFITAMAAVQATTAGGVLR
jgi:hypothetical protein